MSAARPTEDQDLAEHPGRPEDADVEAAEAEGPPIDAAEAVEDGVAGLDQAADEEQREKGRMGEELPGAWRFRSRRGRRAPGARWRHRQGEGDRGRTDERRRDEPEDRVDVEHAEQRAAAEIGDDESDGAAEAHAAIVDAEAADAGQRQRLGDRERQGPQGEGSPGDEEKRQVALGPPGEEEDRHGRERERDRGEAPIGGAVGENPGERRQQHADERRNRDAVGDLDFAEAAPLQARPERTAR